MPTAENWSSMYASVVLTNHSRKARRVKTLGDGPTSRIGPLERRKHTDGSQAPPAHLDRSPPGDLPEQLTRLARIAVIVVGRLGPYDGGARQGPRGHRWIAARSSPKSTGS